MSRKHACREDRRAGVAPSKLAEARAYYASEQRFVDHQRQLALARTKKAKATHVTPEVVVKQLVDMMDVELVT